MKKYITVAALLAAGAAFVNAATEGTIDTTDANLKSYWNFASSANQTSGSLTWNELPTWNKDGQYGVCNTGTTHPYTQNAGLKAADGYTVSFDVKNVENGTLFSMTSSGNMANLWKSLELTYSDGALSAKCLAAASTVATATLSEESNLNEWTTLTLVGRAESTTFCLDLYMNGELKGTSKTATASNMINDTFNYMQFGYYGTSAKSASMYIDNILVYNKALSATEVAALIPEPSAFGLLAGLGALALVGARRRRR